MKIFPLVITAVMLFTIAGCSNKQSEQVILNISAAASMTDAMDAINVLYMDENPDITIVVNYASSGALQQQIAEGAPCDVFLSASAAKMNLLQEADLIQNDTRRDLLTNSIVLIVPIGSTLDITSFNDLTKDYVTIIALGDPSFVPAGKYAQTAFDVLGITDRITGKLLLGADVRTVLTYVETGNVDAGIVYSTDALLSNNVRVVAVAPDEVNATIVYPGAVVKASENTDAAGDYLDFLFGTEAMAVFEEYGFSPVN